MMNGAARKKVFPTSSFMQSSSNNFQQTNPKYSTTTSTSDTSSILPKGMGGKCKPSLSKLSSISSRTSAIPSALQSTNLSQFSMARPTRDKLINMARDTGAKCQMRTSRSSSRKFIEKRKSTVNTTINPLPEMIHKQMSKINLTNESQQPSRMSRLAKSASVHNHPQLSSALCTYGDNKKAAVTNMNRGRSISSSSSHSFNDDDDDDQDDNEKTQTTFTAYKQKSESKAKNGAEKYVSIVRSSSTKNKKDATQTSTFSQIKQTTKNPNNNNKGGKDTHHQIPNTDSLESSSLQSVDITHFSATKYTAHSKDGSTKNFYHTSKSTQRNSRSSSTCKTTVLTAISTCKTSRSSSQTKNYTAISMYSRNNNNNNNNNDD